MSKKNERQEKLESLLELLSNSPKIEEPNYSWAIHRLEEEFPGLKINRVYGMFPTQADGSFQGLGIYARYRWDAFSITMGEQESPQKLPREDYRYESEEYIKDSDGGFLTPEAFYREFHRGFSVILSKIN